MTLANKKIKRGHIWNAFVVTIALGVLSILPISMITEASENSENFGDGIPILVRTANLVSPSGTQNPNGDAEYEVYPNGNRELEIEVEDTTLSQGTVVSFFHEGNQVGTMPIDIDGDAKLRLKTQFGDNVPVTEDGDLIEVKSGETLLVSGVLDGGGPNPTPSPTSSPTASPTSSPTASPTVSPTVSPSPSPGESEIYAALSGSTINGVLPRGYAEYEVEGSETEFEVRIRQINLTQGTPLGIFVDGNQVAQFSIDDDGEARMELESDEGQTVPDVQSNSTVEIKNGGETILSGMFTGTSPSPSPSPTGSPSPSPSPSPSQGRFFETHPSGNNMNPPVNTNGRGEVKVTLNQAETEATVTGEFHNLSSSQTTANIVADLGDSPLIHDFGTIGGTNGNFATATIDVSPAQVQQLRAGLWIATIASANHTDGELRGTLVQHSGSADFDGDGSNDFSLFRPSSGTWFSENSEGFNAENFGTASDIPVSSDFDGDGRTDKAIFKNVNGNAVWEIKRSSDGGITSTQFGFATDKPVRGDFDGDGLNDIAVFRPSTGVWYVRKSNNSGFIIVQFGISTDTPVTGDFDGDGKDDIAVWRESTGVWYWINSSSGNVSIVKWGTNGDKPVVGDFDGDGRTDLTVFRPNTGVWYVYRSSDNSFDIRQFGISEDIPVAGFYDGDDKTDIAVFRPSTGIWYIWKSIDNTYQLIQFGLTGDIPTITQ